MTPSYAPEPRTRSAERRRQRIRAWLLRPRPSAHASRLLLLIGVPAVIIVGATLCRALYLDREQSIDRQWQHQMLLTRLFEDQVTRELDAAHFALAALAQALPGSGPPPEAWAQSARHALALQRSVREFVLLNPQGRWIGGTRSDGPEADAAPVGMEGSAERDLPPQSLRPVLGRWMPGRFWGEQREGGTPPGVGHVPLVLRVERADGVHRLMATMHSEGWSVAMRAALGKAPETATLLAFDGQILAHSGSVALGSNADALLRDLTQAKQRFGRQELTGSSGQIVLRSWRQVGQRPLWLVVERDRDSVTQAWWQQSRAQVFGATVLPLLLGSLLWIGWRSLRRYEREQRRIARSHQALAAHAGELSQVVRSLQEFLFRTDADGSLVFASARARSLFERPPESLLGQPLASLFAPGQEAGFKALLCAPGDSHARTARFRLIDSMKVERLFDITLVPMVDGQGELGFAGSAVECTQRALA